MTINNQLPKQNNIELPQKTTFLPDPQQPLEEQWTEPVHQLFQQQAARFPNKLALQDAASRWTFADLESRSNQLAQALHQAGIQNEDVVAIHATRSASLVWAVLGVLKAGAAFMLLDAAYPASRLRAYLDAATPRGWIGLDEAALPAELAEWLAQANLAATFMLPRTATAVSHPIAQQPIIAPNVSVGPDDLAYVLFTSGSTGKPKGILGRHSPLSHFFPWQIETFGLAAEDRFSMLSGLAHDPLLRDIFTPLLAGATLHIPAQEMLLQPGQLALWLAENNITVSHLTPPMAQVIALTPASQPDPHLPMLRYAFFGGDRLTGQAVQAVRTMAPNITCVNFYGATETPQAMAYHLLSAGDGQAADQPIPLGRGIDSVQIIVAQADGRLAKIGEVGEIFIRTPYLTKGYLNAPELTGERFIPNPHTNDASDLWYRTGDLGHYLPDGQVTFAGRADRQIKIRGFRIEPGEIEAAIQRLTGIQHCLVTPWTEAAGAVRLAAYLVGEAKRPFSSLDLRTELATLLPDYMVPAAFISLKTVPLTPNGKIDYAALPQPETQRPDQNTYVAPRTDTEATLANVWADVLGLARVGIEDNYFDLGGDSILSIRLLSKTRDAGLELSLPDLLRYQTIAALAPHVVKGQGRQQTTQPFQLIPADLRRQLPADVVDAYPLSSLQAGMLYHSQLQPESAVYLNVNVKVVQAAFDQAKMGAALHTLAQRHPILRTSFHLSGYPQPLQFVHEAAIVPLQVDDWRQLPTDEQQTRLADWLAVEQKRPFDWQTAPLLRFHVHRLNEATFQLTMSEHHAILDGWSEAALLSEFFQLYLAELGADVTVPPAPAARYSDFIAAEKAAVAAAQQRDYWTAQVADEPLSHIPRWPRRTWPDPAAAAQPSTQRRFSTALPSDVVAELLRLARETGVHVKHVFLSAHLYVLGLLSGQNEVVTGVVTNGRLEQTDGERVLGLFLNAVPFQQNLAGGTWTDLIRSTFQAEQEMLPHRRFPLIEIQQLRSEHSLFEAIFNFNHFHIYKDAGWGKNLDILEDRYYGSTSDPFSLNVVMDPETAVVELVIEYATDQFPQAQIEAIAGYYAQTLTSMAQQPKANYTLFSPLSAAERRLLLETWNQTNADYPAQSFAHELIAEQAARSPETTAVISNNQTLTYQELVNRANQLAHHLQSLGVKPETIVGISLGRTPDLIVGLLGILTAGGAYLPLDPDYPQDRTAFMIEDTQMPVVLTTAELAEKLPANQATIVKIDADWPTIAQQPTTPPQSGVTPDNLAYIIYTSGSTGRPKGVMVRHSGLTNLCWYTSKKIHKMQSTDRLLQFTTINFDAAVIEIFPTLVGGAALVLSPTNKLSATDMNTLINKHQITLVGLPTAYWQLWVREMEQLGLAFPASLRSVVIGGEAMMPAVVAAWQKLDKNGRVTLYNGYGPTESTVATTLYKVQPNDATISSIPIGRPMDNLSVYVLNQQHQPVPVGVPGELYISGVGIVRGYLHRPERTAQAFLPDPFAKDPEARMYKTGDLVRWLPDGNLEFVGRTDNQIKLRGFRIELGEIETALQQAPGVQEDLVLVHTDANGDKRLVAYILGSQQANPEDLKTQALEAYLLKHLPEYMVPAAFMCLDTWPLTPNGKIDRKALPTNFEMGSEREIVAPRTETEIALAKIWQELLGISQISVHDSFFKLGGHSLMAMQLVSRLHGQFDVIIPLKMLFEAPTLAEMASLINTLQQLFQSLETSPPQVGDELFEEEEI